MTISSRQAGRQAGRQAIVLCFFVASFISVVSILKYKAGEINYRNSDATWHALYTMKCYDETPAQVHKFLPIVSMGRPIDKYISWGACVPDENGNYYYTSFSPASYMAGYSFIKIFHLGFDEKSLYIFNTVLFIISACLLASFLLSLIDNEKQFLLTAIGIIVYVFEPELLHGMGIVYWAQSLLQVTLIAQIYSYYLYHRDNNKKALIVFAFLSILNPYIEWTGYVADFGFALAEFFIRFKENVYKAIVRAEEIIALAVISFGIFCIHYCSVLDADSFFSALKYRFLARNFTTSVSTKSLLLGYIGSFGYFFLLLIITIVVAVVIKLLSRNEVRYCSFLLKNKYLLLVTFIPTLENFIMKEHAISYSYDRMKLIFPLVLIYVDFMGYIISVIKDKLLPVIAIALCGLMSIGNLYHYVNDNSYIWDVNYRECNTSLSNMLTDYTEKACYGYSGAVRGYLNLLLDRGIYECMPFESLVNKAAEHGSRYAVYILPKENSLASWNMYELQGAIVYDLQGDEYTIIQKSGSDFTKTIQRGVIATSRTDENWENGVSRSDNILLFNYSEKTLDELTNAGVLIGVEGKRHKIDSIDFDDNWIRVELNDAPNDCRYPNVIGIE